MQLPAPIQGLITGIRNNDFVSMLILIGIVAAVLIIVAVIVNLKVARENKKKPPADWGTKSVRYRNDR